MKVNVKTLRVALFTALIVLFSTSIGKAVEQSSFIIIHDLSKIIKSFQS